MKFTLLAKISPLILFINTIYADDLRTQINSNSIIKIFCKESVKSEFKKNNFKYDETIGEDICNCYLEKISKNISHKESISRCKLEKFTKN